MPFPEHLLRPLTEANYLTVENSHRYRVIIRLIYQRYEKIQYWTYPEEIFREMKSDQRFQDYTLDECKRDLQALEQWDNVIAVQDASRVRTLEEYKNRNFRYQLSEVTVRIERLMIELENLQVEGAALEPSILERIHRLFEELRTLNSADEDRLGAWWQNVVDQFMTLNQNYQDYIRTLNSADSEELMKTTAFLLYKDSIVEYLRKFVRSLQTHVAAIERIVTQMAETQIQPILAGITRYQLNIPRLSQETVSYEELYAHIKGRWDSMYRWFVDQDGQVSEANRIFDLTNDTIRQITRYASSISEIYGSGLNRKDDYYNLAKLFQAAEDVDACHRIAALAFGVSRPIHWRGEFERVSESVHQSVYDEPAIDLSLKPRKKREAGQTRSSPIRDFRQERASLLAQIQEAQAEEAELMLHYIHDQRLDFASLGKITPRVREILLRWLSKGLEHPQGKGRTEDGRTYQVVLSDRTRLVEMVSEDGTFELPAFELIFQEGGSR